MADGAGFDRMDQNRLQEAKELLIKVLEYNYGAPGMRQKIGRLDTIIKKLEILQNMERRRNGGKENA